MRRQRGDCICSAQVRARVDEQCLQCIERLQITVTCVGNTHQVRARVLQQPQRHGTAAGAPPNLLRKRLKHKSRLARTQCGLVVPRLAGSGVSQ